MRHLAYVAIAACSSSPAHSTVDAPGDLGGSDDPAVVLPLGTVSSVTPLASCPAGAATNATCSTITVHCAGIDDLTATIAVTAPSGPIKGTIFAHLGGGGTQFFTANLAEIAAGGYRTFQIAWTSDWEQTASAGILAAACRPATAMQWAFDNVQHADTSTAFCGIGHSGGSGVLAYSLAHYGMGRVLDYAQLQAGPPFGRIDYGCAPSMYQGPATALCPQLPNAPIALPPAMVGPWENSLDCGSSSPTPADLAKWAADSVVSPGAEYNYPKTPVDFIDCSVQPNGTTGGAYFYSSSITSEKTVTCATQCSGEAIGTDGASQAVSAMLAQCTPRH